MKPRLSLSAKILSLALLNLVLLGATLVGLAGVQLQNLSSLLLAPTRDRVLADARLLALELMDTSASGRDALLAKHSREAGVTFSLYDTHGIQVSGPRMLLPPIVHARAVQGALNESFFVTTRGPTQDWMGVRIPIGSPEGGDPLPGILILMSSSLLGNAYFLDLSLVGLVLLVVVLISVACWVPLIRRLTRGISQVTEAAGQIAEGRFDVQVAADRGDELGQLGTAVNQMAARLSGFVQGQKRFLGDIAHELCSPIARIHFGLGVLEQRVDAENLEHVKDVREEVEHMSALVAELLTFSKAGMQSTEVRRVPVAVAETARQAAARESVAGTTVNIAVDEQLQVMADPDYLFRSLSNLIRNSIRYAGEFGPIRVSAETEGSGVRITVTDSGPGLPEEALEEVFTPFHRPELARTRETGGAGLGLAIVKSCIEACQGSVRCRNIQPHGLAVDIRLAAAQ
ncbi:MAG TPA: HAMP domain-containing sensor histidine kinase [Bryobacteraceae bacterium]|nr:HAMP domain-containing sensor histidine kinase [Bryobacteraceae bacterium]